MSAKCIPCMQVCEGTHGEVEAFVHGALCVSYRYAAPSLVAACISLDILID